MKTGKRILILAGLAAILFAVSAADKLNPYNSPWHQRWSDLDSLTTATADTITIDWSDTAKIPSRAKFVCISGVGIWHAYTVTVYPFSVDILIGGVSQPGNFTSPTGTTVTTPNMCTFYDPPLVFKRADGNVKFVLLRGATSSVDFWVNGWYE